MTGSKCLKLGTLALQNIDITAIKNKEYMLLDYDFVSI